MSVKIEGTISVVATDCRSAELGMETARRLLGPLVVVPVAEKFSTEKLQAEMQDLLLGLLVGTVGLFAQRLMATEIEEQLYRCKQMVEEVPGFSAPAQKASAGKGVH